MSKPTAPHLDKKLGYHFLSWMESRMNTILELEQKESIDEKQLKFQIYKLGVDMYRQFNNLPHVISYKEPFSYSPCLEWSNILCRYVKEEDKDELELERVREYASRDC